MPLQTGFHSFPGKKESSQAAKLSLHISEDNQ